MNWIKYLFILLISFNSRALTLEEERKYDELEGFNFVKTLYADRKYLEVIRYGEKLKVSAGEQGDLYYFLADSYYNTKKYSIAKGYLDKSLSLSKTNQNSYFLTLAKVHYELKDYNSCIDSINRVNKWVLKLDDWKLLTKCMESENRVEDLIAIYLNTTIDDFDFILEAQNVLLKYNLHQVAKQSRSNLFEKCYMANDYINLITIFETYKVKDSEFLELAHRCHPNSIEISGHLIKLHYNETLNNSLAYTFLNLSLDDIKFRKHTAEFYKVAKRNVESTYFSSIADAETYVLSRAENYLNTDSIASLYSLPISSEYLKKNKDLAYAKAYSALKFMKTSEAKNILIKEVSKRSQKEEALLAIIDKCSALDYQCRP